MVPDDLQCVLGQAWRLGPVLMELLQTAPTEAYRQIQPELEQQRDFDSALGIFGEGLVLRGKSLEEVPRGPQQ